MTAVVDELFELFSDLEDGKSFRGNRHRRARPRIAAGVGLVRTDGEAAKSANLYSLAVLQGFGHRVEHAVDDELRPRLREVAAQGHRVDEFALRHVGSAGLGRLREMFEGPKIALKIGNRATADTSITAFCRLERHVI